MTPTQESLSVEQVEQLIGRHFEAQKNHKTLLSKQQMYDALKTLPDETQRAFETTVVKQYALQWADSNIEQELQELIALAEKDAPTEEEKKVAFCAFCVAVNYERRQKNFSKEEELLANCPEEFKHHVFYRHMHLLSKMEELEGMEDIEPSEDRATQKRRKEKVDQLRAILQLAEQNGKDLSGNIGGWHAFAETVALAFENAPSMMQSLEQERCNADEKAGWHDPLCRGWLYHAIDAVNRAVQIDVADKRKADKDKKGAKPYPKFLVTKARLVALSGEFEEALGLIKNAIDTEDNQQSDYSIRIGQYRAHRQQILARKTALSGQKILDEQLSATMQEYERKLEEQEKQTIVKNMEFLGLFSGIVSFTIGSLTIGSAVADQSILHAAGLIVVLMGALMGVFAAFGIILHGVVGKKAGRNFFVLLLGIAIVVGGILLCLR